MKKAIIISCYFGTLPNYFNLFLKSCSKNSGVDFLFVTDCVAQIKTDIPENFHILSMKFQELVSVIKNTLGQDCVCHKPYKLCDYKPVYGLLFSEQTKDYDYWGHGDIDLIFGNLERFISKPMDNGFDKIFKYGHLTLYKNTPANNMAYKKKFSGINYKYVFSHNHSFGFDERKGMHKLYQENNISYCVDDFCLDTKPPVYKIINLWGGGSQKITFCNQQNYDKQFVLWDNGHIFLYYIEKDELRLKEHLYIHLQKRKFDNNNVNTDRFIVLPSSFIDVDAVDKSVLSKFDFEPKIKRKYILPSLYRLHNLWYKITYNRWHDYKGEA